MRTFFVVLSPPFVQKGLLLLSPLLNFTRHIQMKAFVGRIVLWAAGATTFQIDPQHQPPDRESAQSKQSVTRGKGGAIVAPDRSRQSVFLKEIFETIAHGL